MASLRSSLRSSPLRRSFATAAPRAPFTRSTFKSPHRFYAQQSYGSGEGDPKGENPQEQGANPSADLEHPGPPPPDVGKGTGGGPTKAGGEGHGAGQQSSSSGAKSGGTGKSANAEKGKEGAKPKILDESSPPAEPSEDVKKHNEEMDQRYEKAANHVDEPGNDNVGKGFWKGRSISFLVDLHLAHSSYRAWRC